MSVQTILRQQISANPESDTYQRVLQLLEERNKGGLAEVLRALRALADPFLEQKDSDDRRLNRFFPLWGYLPEDGDPEETRRQLLDEEVLLTRVTGVSEDQIQRNLDLETIPRIDERLRPVTGIDVPVALADYAASEQHFSSRRHRAATFGTARDAMLRLEQTWAARTPFSAPAGEDGEGVNVVIVDEGFNIDYLNSLMPAGQSVNFRGGFIDRKTTYLPGQFNNPLSGASAGHGNMVARNILRIAPKVNLYDAAFVLPFEQSGGVNTTRIEYLLRGIWYARFFNPLLAGETEKPWIIVNAWAVSDSIADMSQPLSALGIGPENRYTDGALHPLNTLAGQMSPLFNLVFAAGNGGSFAPVRRTGMYSSGPDRAIAGANALPSVLTVAATDITRKWVGTSAQGRGPATLDTVAPFKPDISLPSWFCEDDDRGRTNTGTSAACAIAAGILASRRTVGGPSPTTSDALDEMKTGAAPPAPGAPTRDEISIRRTGRFAGAA